MREAQTKTGPDCFGTREELTTFAHQKWPLRPLPKGCFGWPCHAAFAADDNAPPTGLTETRDLRACSAHDDTSHRRATWQSVFSVWSTLNEQRWSTFRERRGPDCAGFTAEQPANDATRQNLWSAATSTVIWPSWCRSRPMANCKASSVRSHTSAHHCAASPSNSIAMRPSDQSGTLSEREYSRLRQPPQSAALPSR